MNRFINILIQVFCFILCFFLQELPESFFIQKIIPEWPFIMTLFFLVNTKEYFSLSGAFIIGLLQDLFLSTTLGVHAVIYVLLGFLFLQVSVRRKVISITTQASFVAFFVLLKVLLVTIYSVILYGVPIYFWEILSIFFSFFAWFIICYIFIPFFSKFYKIET